MARSNVLAEVWIIPHSLLEFVSDFVLRISDLVAAGSP
jgi:hypothetical protein